MGIKRLVGSVVRLAVLCGVAGSAFATSVGPAFPSFVTYNNNGLVYVYFLNNIRSGTSPACAGNTGGQYYRLVFDGTTAAGKVMVAGLVAAHTAGEQVWAFGTGDCGIDGVNESLANFHTAN